MLESLLGEILALVTALAWAINGVYYRKLGLEVDSNVLAHFRMWVAVPVIFLFTLVTDHSLPLGYSLSSYVFLFISGALGYFVTDMLLFRSYVLLGARETLVVMTFTPAVSAILSFFVFGEVLSFLEILGILMTIIGIVVMGSGEKDGEKGSNIRKGLQLAFLAAIFQSLSYLTAKFALEDIPAVSSNLIRNMGGLLAFILWAPFFQKNFRRDRKVFRKPRVFSILLLCVVAGPVVGMSAQMLAFNYAPIGIVTAISQLSPVLLLPFDYFSGKKLTFASILGTLISMGGVILLLI